MCGTGDDIPHDHAPGDRRFHVLAIGFQSVKDAADAEDRDLPGEYSDDSRLPLAEVSVGTDLHSHRDNITSTGVLDTNDSSIGRLNYISANSVCGGFGGNVLSDNRFSWRRDLEISVPIDHGQNPLPDCGFCPLSGRRMSLTLNQLNPLNSAGIDEKELDKSWSFS